MKILKIYLPSARSYVSFILKYSILSEGSKQQLVTEHHAIKNSLFGKHTSRRTGVVFPASMSQLFYPLERPGGNLRSFGVALVSSPPIMLTFGKAGGRRTHCISRYGRPRINPYLQGTFSFECSIPGADAYAKLYNRIIHHFRFVPLRVINYIFVINYLLWNLCGKL